MVHGAHWTQLHNVQWCTVYHCSTVRAYHVAEPIDSTARGRVLIDKTMDNNRAPSLTGITICTEEKGEDEITERSR